MLAIQIIRAQGLPTKDDNYFATVNFCGEEIFCTEGCNRESNGDPVWQDADEFSLDEFNGKEEENKRPLFLEKISVQVYADRGERKAEFIGEARVPLFNIGPPQWNKLVPKSADVILDAQILTCLSFPQSKMQQFSDISFLQLSDVLDIHEPQNSSLFLNFGKSSLALFGANPLPGPICGEILLDYHGNVEVEMNTGINLFKDKCTVSCEGSLYLTDLRLIFIPSVVKPSPPGFLNIPYVSDGSACVSEEQLLAIRRMIMQFPISGIQDIKCHSPSKSTNIAELRIVCRNSTCAEFIISGMHGISDGEKSSLETKLGKKFYTGGLLSRDMPPLLWCTRLTNELKWMLHEDFCWVRWAEYLGLTLNKLFPAAPIRKKSFHGEGGFVFREFAPAAQPPRLVMKLGKKASIRDMSKESKSTFLNKFHSCVKRFVDVPISKRDFRRMRLETETSWKISNLNDDYKLCSTYPDVLVFPSALTDEDVREASLARSKERLPSLVWIHPKTRTPLCRCAQPLAGISGVYVTEPDVKMCLAIRSTSHINSKQLRILDCRPKINAHANAIQGKGFENVASLGGSDGATLVFADIHNIHAVRESLQKLRESNGSSEGDDSNSAAAVSKWLQHVSSVLRGAATVAESLLLDFPVLVHCSDGWDRTSQITSLSQMLLEPYYRTVDGFLMLLEKEWISFGFQFGERLGPMTDKNTSPVFTQFLDCVWQLINQFPTEFEFSSGLLEVIIMCAYSGFFSSFRQNCEWKRCEELSRHAGSTLNTSFSIVHFSSVFTYIHILLASDIGALLINPRYRKEHCDVKYLHPRCGVEDLFVWNQGLMPRSFNCFSQGGGRTILSKLECDALSSSSHSSLLSEWTMLLKHVPLGIGNRFDVVNGQHHGPLLTVQTPHKCSRQSERIPFLKTFLSSSYEQISGSNGDASAIIRIQIWYRAFFAFRKYAAGMNVDKLSIKVRKIVNQLLQLYCRSRFKEAISKYVVKKKIISAIITDLVEFVMTTCDEMQRTCSDLITYEENTVRGTAASEDLTERDSDFESDDERVRASIRSSSNDSFGLSKVKSSKGNITSSFFSKISKGFHMSKKEK